MLCTTNARWQRVFTFLLGLAVCSFLVPNVCVADVVATYDTDSYLFIGTNNATSTGVSLGADNSGGMSDGNIFGHFNFGYLAFDDLSGLETEANGGGRKLLTVNMVEAGNSAVIAISAANADIRDTYPSTIFGNAPGNASDRLAWYQDNIKGDEASYGGYAGGAAHLGVINAVGSGEFSLDVTSTVDAWLDGSLTNNGFGLWAVTTTATQGANYDIASLENVALPGARLTIVAVPEPNAAVCVLFGVPLLLFKRRRSLTVVL